jgi:hypothetical protein
LERCNFLIEFLEHRFNRLNFLLHCIFNFSAS